MSILAYSEASICAYSILWFILAIWVLSGAAGVVHQPPFDQPPSGRQQQMGVDIVEMADG